jgi:hypothetical protein
MPAALHIGDTIGVVGVVCCCCILQTNRNGDEHAASEIFVDRFCTSR